MAQGIEGKNIPTLHLESEVFFVFSQAEQGHRGHFHFLGWKTVKKIWSLKCEEMNRSGISER
jgi:hypothetical protein